MVGDIIIVSKEKACIRDKRSAVANGGDQDGFGGLP